MGRRSDTPRQIDFNLNSGEQSRISMGRCYRVMLKHDSGMQLHCGTTLNNSTIISHRSLTLALPSLCAKLSRPVYPRDRQKRNRLSLWAHRHRNEASSRIFLTRWARPLAPELDRPRRCEYLPKPAHHLIVTSPSPLLTYDTEGGF